MTRKFSIFNFQFSDRRQGVAALTVTLLLGGLIIEIGLVGAFIFYLVNFTNYGIRVSSEAYAAAQAGIQEGFMRLVRQCTQGGLPDLILGNGARAEIQILDDGNTCSGETGSITRTIVAKGRSLTKARKLRAIVEISRETRTARILTVEETTLP